MFCAPAKSSSDEGYQEEFEANVWFLSSCDWTPTLEQAKAVMSANIEAAVALEAKSPQQLLLTKRKEAQARKKARLASYNDEDGSVL